MHYTYKLNGITKEQEEKIRLVKDVKNVVVENNTLSFDAGEDSYPSIEKIIDSSTHYKTYVLPVSIDCAECAREVEEGLSKIDGNAFVSFSYTKATLKIITSNSLSSVKESAKKIEDDISFLDDMEKKYSFSVKFKDKESASNIATQLKSNPNFSGVKINYEKGDISLSSSLNEDEIVGIIQSLDSSIVFLKKEKNYVFSVTIDCAECAQKVEEGLRKNSKIKKVNFDFPKGKLYVTSSLTEEEIRDEAKSIESDIVFHTSQIAEKKDYSLYRILVALLFFAIAKISHFEYLAIISYLIAGYDVLYKAIKNITKGKIFDENFLMSIATLAALFIQSFDEAAAVMIFYQIGEYFQRKAVGSSRESIGKLMDLSSDSVNVKRNDEWKKVKPEDVKEGEIIELKSGEKLALDSIVIEGESYMDERALTGESVPVKVTVGDSILSGCVNGDSTLILKVEKKYSESTASKIMNFVEESEGKKASSEKFITKFSRYYTPFVCLMALFVATIPSLLGLTEWKESIYRAAMLLVISCPCALVLSVPLTYFSSIGSFAKHGILVKGDNSISALNKAKIVAMDKTGTLTEGIFSVQSIEYLSTSIDHLLDVAYSLERESTHPIASAIINYAGERNLNAENVHTLTGIGIEGDLNGKKIKAGSKKIMANCPSVDRDGTLIYVTEDDKLLGVFVISDKIRDSSYSTIKSLRENGIEKIYMLSGDRKERAEKTALSLGLDKAYGELLPNDKLEVLKKLKKEGTLIYVGDGINDAPSLKEADIGVAMGGVGSDTAIVAADCVIMNDDLSRLPVAINISKKTERIAKENIIFALFVKALIFILAIFGFANMWIAVFADTGVSLLCVINSIRAYSYKEKKLS